MKLNLTPTGHIPATYPTLNLGDREMLEFTYKSTPNRDRFRFSPVGDKAKWAVISRFMKSTNITDLQYVGDDGEYLYFQQIGNSNGLARIAITDVCS